MKKVLLFLLLGIVLFFGFLFVNMSRQTTKQFIGVPTVLDMQISDSVVFHLAEAIRIRTVSYQDVSLMDSTQFDKFIVFLAKTYPLIHANLTLEKVNNFSLLYKWNGKNQSILNLRF